MTRKQLEALIRKTIATSDFLDGGQLDPERQDEFIKLVRAFPALLPRVRFKQMKQKQAKVDRLHVGETITVPAGEDDSSVVLQKPKYDQLDITVDKYRSAWNITMESLIENIEREDFEDLMFQAYAEKIGDDVEDLLINGDDAITASDPRNTLLKNKDGWIQQMLDRATIFDAGGATISLGLFQQALRKMPKEYRGDPGLRWVASDSLKLDWDNYIADRATTAGDRALGGVTPSPAGKAMLLVPRWPDDLAVSAGAATAGHVTGSRFGPFEIRATGTPNNKFKLDIDNAGAVTVTLPTGTQSVQQIAKAINDAVSAVVAGVNPYGQLTLVSPTVGASSQLEIQAVADDAYATLGFTAGDSDGTASGGTVEEGTKIALVNPSNLVWGMLLETRVYSKFNQDADRIETRVYNHVGCTLENPEAIVLVDNVKLRTLV